MKKSGLLLLLAFSICFGQTGDKSISETSATTKFEKVSLCQLTDDPGAFNRKPVEVAAFVSHGFEDSSIYEPGCGKRYSGIWMEYRGNCKHRNHVLLRLYAEIDPPGCFIGGRCATAVGRKR